MCIRDRLVARGFERIFWRELLGFVDARAGRALFLHLPQMPATGPLHEALSRELADSARPAATVLHEERAMLAGDTAAEDYLAASMSAKKRKELRRQHRRLADQGALASEHRRDAHGLDDWCARFLALEQSGWKGRAGSALASDARTAQVFREALAGAARQGRLDRLSLTLDGRPIAMLATFLAEPGAFSFKTAFDETFARYSPGVLLQCEALAGHNAARVRWVDSCAAEDHPMIDHIWRERRAIAAHSIAIGGPLRRAAFNAIARRETGSAPTGIAR